MSKGKKDKQSITPLEGALSLAEALETLEDYLSVHRDRMEMIAIVATMPDEAFGGFVAWAAGYGGQFPDGLGGFQDDSRQSIAALRDIAREWMPHPDVPGEVPAKPASATGDTNG